METHPDEAPMTSTPHPALDDLLAQLGDCGQRLAALGACEGGAGNLSVALGAPLDLARRFPVEERVALPHPAPELAGATLVVSGSGTRLRDIAARPGATLACLVVLPGGREAVQHTAPDRSFTKVTSEFNSHLAVHQQRPPALDGGLHAVVHAQPPHLTWLSHIDRYQDGTTLNRRLLRWQPETILNLPEGIAVAPFEVPGSDALTSRNAALCRDHQVVLWARHGVLARADRILARAVDLIEYVEASARYEWLNLSAGEPASGLSDGQLRAICAAAGLQQGYF
jgi:rhamnulose-1-phosphate aldolase